MSNSTAKLLKTVSIVIWVLGSIGSLMVYESINELGYYFEGIASNLLLASLFSTFTSGLTFYGLAYITETVSEIKNFTFKQGSSNQEDEVLAKF